MPQPPVVIVNPVAQTCVPDQVRINQTHGRGAAIFFVIDPSVAGAWSWSQSPDPIVLDNAGSIFPTASIRAMAGARTASAC